MVPLHEVSYRNMPHVFRAASPPVEPHIAPHSCRCTTSASACIDARQGVMYAAGDHVPTQRHTGLTRKWSHIHDFGWHSLLETHRHPVIGAPPEQLTMVSSAPSTGHAAGQAPYGARSRAKRTGIPFAAGKDVDERRLAGTGGSQHGADARRRRRSFPRLLFRALRGRLRRCAACDAGHALRHQRYAD